MSKRVGTPIDGLTVLLNRAVGDERGWLGELVPNGAAHQDLSDGLGNIYVSIVLGKGIARAGHYHHRQSELFFTLTGTALWAFRDYREESSTFGRVYAVIFTDSSVPPGSVPVYVIGTGAMPGIVVPHGVYHVYWALSEAPVRVVCVATTPHDDTDYVRLQPVEVPDLATLIKEYRLIP